MHRLLPLLAAALLCNTPTASAQRSDLTVEVIMQDPDSWVGGLPGRLSWSELGDELYFWWNPDGQFPSDSLYVVSRSGGEPRKLSPAERRDAHPTFSGWQHDSRAHDTHLNRKVYAHDGDLYVFDRASGVRTRLTATLDDESNPRFLLDDAWISFERSDNLYRMDLATGIVRQLTDIRSGEAPSEEEPNEQDAFLERQQLRLFEYIREQDEEEEEREAARERDETAEDRPPTYYTGRRILRSLQVDPTARFVTFTLTDESDSRTTMSVRLVTESGYPVEETWRSKVGTESSTVDLYVQDLERDTTYRVDLHELPGMYEVPEYMVDQGVEMDSSESKRVLQFPTVTWSPDARFAVVEVHARDNKDRWIARLDPESGTVTPLDRQHDEAWVGGPINASGWIPGTSRFYFQSERTGFSHLYVVDVATRRVTQLTDGDFEVYSPQLSRDASQFTFSSSEVAPFERHFYRMSVNGGARERLTTMQGRNDIELHPEGVTMGNLFSYTNRPPEVYLHLDSREPERITHSPTDEWLAHDWRDPEIIRFEASDGAMVPAQLFVPESPNGAAVIFVHGAGYLQNVHRWWSSYFREYMFNNLLTDLGYYVMNVDYRASAGYGRDWRTAIYRHMGGRDLQDHVDASRYLQDTHDIDAERVGIYGGSYGGFITLMALFTEPEHFGAGAALRSVTDWAHYNHGYTSNILNTPATDSLSYARSSPINFADGLEDPLLMPHGMLDNNVHFQDIIRLAQRLIELGKEDWELAVYPVERHSFTEPDSWTDEYRRVLKLFETTIAVGD